MDKYKMDSKSRLTIAILSILVLGFIFHESLGSLYQNLSSPLYQSQPLRLPVLKSRLFMVNTVVYPFLII